MCIGNDATGNAVLYAVYILNGQCRALCYFGDYLLVIVGDSELFRKPPAELSPAASELSSERDDPVHI